MLPYPHTLLKRRGKLEQLGDLLAYAGENWRTVVPSLVTLVGHALTVRWLLFGGLLFGMVGLSCDCIDGAVARYLGTSSRFGSLYDWTCDVTICALCLVRLPAQVAWPLLLVIVPAQVFCRMDVRRFSGRTLAQLVLILLEV